MHRQSAHTSRLIGNLISIDRSNYTNNRALSVEEIGAGTVNYLRKKLNVQNNEGLAVKNGLSAFF